MWVHPPCVPLTEEEFQDYGQSEDYFLCPRCVSTSDDDVGVFDISKCLKRYTLIILLFNSTVQFKNIFRANVRLGISLTSL